MEAPLCGRQSRTTHVLPLDIAYEVMPPYSPRHCAAREFRVMLVLFCSSVMLQDAKSIPPREIAFYVFMGVSISKAVLSVSALLSRGSGKYTKYSACS